MERDTFKDDLADTVATRPNARGSAPLVINRNGSRKDLFGSRQFQPNKASNGSHARSGSATLSQDQKPISPNSRMPRPNSNSPRPLSLKDAYRLAEEADQKEAAQGSPSPAPRTWRSRLDGREKTDKSPSQGQGSRRRTGIAKLGTSPPHRRDTASPVDSLGANKHGDDDSDSDIDHKIKQFGKEQQHGEGNEPHGSGGSNGLFANSRLGPKVTETGKELSRKASNGSLDGIAPSTGYRPWGLKAGTTAGLLKRAMSSPEKCDDIPRIKAPSGDAPISAPIPNKSFARDADEDFTAGDLFVSDSPPVRAARPNSPPIYRNTKLDEIRALEVEAALKFPDEIAEPANEYVPSDQRRRSGSAETHSPLDRPIGRTNTKIDEIRVREIESLSRRAVATARLDEIRERNSEARSRSSSPEIPRKPSRDVFREPPLFDNEPPNPQAGPLLEAGEQIPNAPATVLRGASPEADKDKAQEEPEHAGSCAASRGSQRDPLSRADSHDLLRRLARAASTSPAPEHQTARNDAKDLQDPTTEPEKESVSRLRKERNANRSKAVGFAGLRREPSAESVSESKSKRSSLALSDSDPTERIEREMQLFAPMDNHSERGSIRAPSPESEMDDDIEENPRPVRIDPLTQPTLRVTGAYIETPTTVKAERPEDLLAPVEPNQEGGTSTDSPTAGAARGRKVEISLRKPVQTASAEGDRDTTRAKSQPRSFQRSKSLPRARSPLINSVRPPTVKDDLLEIQRTYQIEDSTVDDLDSLFSRDIATDTSFTKEELEIEPVKIEITEAQDLPMDEKNSKAINRIDRSLESIRTARKGIERLEGEVSKASEAGHKASVRKPEMADPQHHAHSDHITSACPVCLAQSPSNMVAYVHVPLPCLWRRNPTFKLTLLGFIISVLSLWYLAESTMCTFYCKPQYCYPGKPCNWSYDDPFWGYAIPVKLDQWTTGGQGRVLVEKVRPEIADWVADVWDVVTGTDIRTADTRGYDWDQRRQHRRRMRKKGFVKPFVPRPEDREKHEAWRRARIAKEEADARREMGYPDYDEGETMAADERVK